MPSFGYNVFLKVHSIIDEVNTELEKIPISVTTLRREELNRRYVWYFRVLVNSSLPPYTLPANCELIYVPASGGIEINLYRADNGGITHIERPITHTQDPKASEAIAHTLKKLYENGEIYWLGKLISSFEHKF
jgi:hypothetical protein